MFLGGPVGVDLRGGTSVFLGGGTGVVLGEGTGVAHGGGFSLGVVDPGPPVGVSNGLGVLALCPIPGQGVLPVDDFEHLVVP